MDPAKKTIRVVAAIISDNGKYFVTQRGYGEWKGFWEFPGGKIEPGESPEDALRREIKEELEADISVSKRICAVEYNYPKFHLSMECFLARVKRGDLVLKEHDAAKWLDLDNLDSVEWLPADKIVIEALKNE